MQSVAATDLTYHDYLKIPELLNLQVPQSKPPHPDELLFITIHQSYELWFKLVLAELDRVVVLFAENRVFDSNYHVHRATKILGMLVSQIHILETMSPIQFLAFRENLRPASGFQSIQFRELEFFAGIRHQKYFDYFKNRPDLTARLEKRQAEPDLGSLFIGMLGRLGYAVKVGAPMESLVQGLLPIYQKPAEHSQVYQLCESLIELDENLTLWREHHIRVVERVIGAKPGTGGSDGVPYLRSTVEKRCFPILWELRTSLTI